MNPLTQSKNITILPVLISLTLGCFGLSPQARAVCQDGCDISLGNTFQGNDALLNTTGSDNTAIGATALFSDTRGFQNTATGSFALQNNTLGGQNTAIGAFALQNNTTGIVNTATGALALQNNTRGDANTATGFQALVSNTTGDHNTAIGEAALNLNTTGNDNTANSYFALENNTTGSENTAIGANALQNNGTGNSNTASGFQALLNNTTGNNNIALGFQAGINHNAGNNNIYVGSGGAFSESRTIRIGAQHGRTFVAGISGVTVAGGVGVIIDTNGQLGTVVSSERFKDAIKPMDKASEAILALKPVTFRYRHELDPEGVPQFGLVAEDVEKVNPDLVARDEQGKPYTVRYDAVNVMLLNEFLKEHRKVAEQEATIMQLKAELQATTTRQQKQIEALTAGLQKVSAQLEVNNSAPQTVLNDH